MQSWHDLRFVGQPDHQRQAGILGVLLVLHEVLQEWLRILLLQPLRGAGELQTHLGRGIPFRQLGEALEHGIGNCAGFAEQANAPGAHVGTGVA